MTEEMFITIGSPKTGELVGFIEYASCDTCRRVNKAEWVREREVEFLTFADIDPRWGHYAIPMRVGPSVIWVLMFSAGHNIAGVHPKAIVHNGCRCEEEQLYRAWREYVDSMGIDCVECGTPINGNRPYCDACSVAKKGQYDA